MRRMYDKEEIKEIVGSGSGSTIDSLDLVVGQPTVTYDTAKGIAIKSTGKLNGTDDIVVSNEIPIVAGDNISIDKAADSEKIVIKSTLDDSNYAKLNQLNAFNTNKTIIEQYEGTENNSGLLIKRKTASTENLQHWIRLNVKDNNYSSITLCSGFNTSTGNINTLNIYPEYIEYVDLQKRSQIFFPKASGLSDVFLTKNTVKTLFGNKSIVGTGNINLYCHNISFSNKIFLTAYSSNELQVTSLTDLQTVFPEDVWKSATGTSADDSKQVIAINCKQMKVRYTDSTEDSLEAYEAPVDTVTAI